MSSQVNALYDPWGRSLLQALRRFWWLPVLLAVLGAVAGGIAGNVAQPSAQALVRVDSAADNAGTTGAMQTAVQELDTLQVYTAAVKGTKVSPAQLRERTEVATITDSQVLSVTVTAPTVEEAVREADAIVDAAIQQGLDRRDEELSEVTKQTRSLISKSKLSDSDAEKARVASLGDALANSQSQLIANARQLTLLAPAASSSITPQPALLTALGAIGGALAGAALALLFGSRRGTVKSVKELRRLYPHVPVIQQEELGSLVDMELATTSTWVVGGLGLDGESLRPVTDELTTYLAGAGLNVQLSDSLSVLRERRGHRRAATDEVTVIATSVNQAIVRSVERDQEASLLLVVEPQHTRHEWLGQYAAIFGDHTFLLVANTQSHWKW